MSRTTFFKVYSKKDLSLVPIHEKLSKLKLVSFVKEFIESFRVPHRQYCLVGDSVSVLAGKSKFVSVIEICVSAVVFIDFDFKIMEQDGVECKRIHPNIVLKRETDGFHNNEISTFKEVRYTNV